MLFGQDFENLFFDRLFYSGSYDLTFVSSCWIRQEEGAKLIREVRARVIEDEASDSVMLLCSEHHRIVGFPVSF